MKKILSVLIAVMLIVAMAIPAHAVTPELDVPDMPAVPDIGNGIDFGIDIGGIVGDWLEANPAPPLVPAEPVEEPTAPVGNGWFNWLHVWDWWGWRHVVSDPS